MQSAQGWYRSLLPQTGEAQFGIVTFFLSILLVVDSSSIPASWCGVYGIKTSHGRISSRPSVSSTPGVGNPFPLQPVY